MPRLGPNAVSETELAKLVQVVIATVGLFGLSLLLAPRAVLEYLTRERARFSPAAIVFFRLAGALVVAGACFKLFG
jgi:hypothetical protein